MKRLLVVDTEQEERIALCTMIRDLGYSVEEAEDGRECLGRVRKEAFDLVVIDLVMSDMSGWDLLEALKDAHPALPVVVMTREVDDEGEALLTSRRADGYLIKPPIPRRVDSLFNALLSDEGMGEQADVTVVDTSKETLDRIDACLSDRGLYVYGFEDPDAAYRHIRSRGTDLVVVELELFPGSGLELCRSIRYTSGIVYTPILLTASRPTRRDIERAVRLRVNGVLKRPVDEEELGERAVAAIRQSRSRGRHTPNS